MSEFETVNNILIVDDSSTARFIIRQCFEIAGFRGKNYVEAKNGLEALESLEKEKFDLIVTDLNMPGMDGIGLLSSVKASRHSEIPVIVITSTSNQAKNDELKKLGAFLIFNKPISPAGIHQAWETSKK